MTKLAPGVLSFGNATYCHVCGSTVDAEDFGIDHNGHVAIQTSGVDVEGHGHIIFHAECATVLAMRLIHDAMAHKERTAQIPLRAVEVLCKHRKGLLNDSSKW
jgi:hypothetical protein